MSKFTARDVEVLSRISAALQVIDHDVTELNAVILKMGKRVKPEKLQPKIGDRIRVTKSDHQYFSKGDIALVIEVHGRENPADTHVTADFNNQGNLNVYQKGLWCIASNNLEVVAGVSK